MDRYFSLHDYRALAELRYQVRRFLAYREEVGRMKGLQPAQYQMMLAIKGAPAGTETTVGMLSERMLVRHHTAVEMVDRLAKRGLVLRVRHKDDRRKMLVKLTAKGERLLRALVLASRDELKTSGPALLAVLRRLMRGK